MLAEYVFWGKQRMSNNGTGTEDADKDAVDILPLSSISLASSALKNAKLIKNARMETAIELCKDTLTGSLQIAPDAIKDFMDAAPRDQQIINSLASLNSFDVYSLRSSLKKLGVEVKDVEALELSADMKEKLASYSVAFIRPLVEKIFGQGRADLMNGVGLKNILNDPDMRRVKENLMMISQKTGIPLAGIPKFLEEYSDVFLSVAYYRYSFDRIMPDVDRFLSWMQEVRCYREVASSPPTLAQCKQVEETLCFLSQSIRERLAQFQDVFELFWADINRDSFLQMRRQIEGNHASMGAVLCGLVVKMGTWKKEFSDNTVGGPSTRIKFVLTTMAPGIVKLRDLEQAARAGLGLAAR